MFSDQNRKTIYVGKAKNLHHRVSSYFRDPSILGLKTSQMISKARFLSYIEVHSELEAILLESRLINKLQPFYNLISKDDKSPYFIHFTDTKYPKPIINHIAHQAVAGPFLNRYLPEKILRLFRRIAPFCTASSSQKRACLYTHLGLCNPCPHGPDFSAKIYRQNLRRLSMLLKGNFSKVQKSLQSQMKIASHHQDYESASGFRDQLFQLNALIQKPIMPDDYLLDPNLEIDSRSNSLIALAQLLQDYYPNINLSRIETYDIANLQGKNATAAMTVSVNGVADSKNFRHFNIKFTTTPNDPAMLTEVITRRLKHLDWPSPGLIVLDGGKPQLSVLLDHFPKLQIPVISLAKRFETIYIKSGSDFREIIPPKDNPGLRLVQHLRNEAHRFSRRLHHHKRKQDFLL